MHESSQPTEETNITKFSQHSGLPAPTTFWGRIGSLVREMCGQVLTAPFWKGLVKHLFEEMWAAGWMAFGKGVVEYVGKSYGVSPSAVGLNKTSPATMAFSSPVPSPPTSPYYSGSPIPARSYSPPGEDRWPGV